MPVYSLGDRRPALPEEGQYWIAPDAHVIGDVSVGVDVGLWFGAVARGDNEPMRIGAGTNVQEGVMLHSDAGSPLSIGTDCTIGHHAIVHGCTVGNNVLVGMGATILNDAVIGDDSIVGANALVTAGKSFAPRMLIMGAPARAVRELSDDEVEANRRSARNYVRNWQRFRDTLKPL